ncbi:MAG TPA: hypothetical protein ENN46_02710 [Candidatus Woesearchaeota archaeon]|nr:hypothetical protein [Candidatus Woesearchaeota archaeon]
METKCVFCKGRLYCGRKACPITVKMQAKIKSQSLLKKDFFGKSPSIFVGRFGYPDVSVGFLSAEDYNKHDEPIEWSRENAPISKVIQLRSELVNSRLRMNIKESIKRTKINEAREEVALARKPVDVEISLKKIPNFSMSFNDTITPFGPSARLEKIDIAQNPKIPYKVEKAIADETKASDAIASLRKKYDVYYLTKVLSSGSLGRVASRKLVPTRWAITATDDIYGKDIAKNLVKYRHIEENNCFFGMDYGNFFMVLMLPGQVSYELFEVPVPQAKKSLLFGTNYESIFGRKEYATETAGGYYASRLSVFEKLEEMKRQASVIVVRLITKDYWAPLGVWVVRETVKKVFESKPVKFSEQTLMALFAVKYAKKHFSTDISQVFDNSRILREAKSQKKLTELFSPA